MGKRSREKGAEAERYAAMILRTLYPDAQRRVTGEEAQAENLGRDLKGTPGLCVQVKENATPQPLKALEEAIGAARGGEVPVAIVRQSTKAHSTPFRVVMRLDDFLHMVYACRFASVTGHELNAALDQLRESSPNMKARLG